MFQPDISKRTKILMEYFYIDNLRTRLFEVYPQLNEALADWQNLIWLMDFTQVFPVYLNVFVFTQIWLKLFSFARI